MTYNIHPIIVHFPIALLFIYSIIKVLPITKWWPNVSWKHIERVFLFLGVLGALAALLTGSAAKEMVHPDPKLVGAHGMFAFISVIIYGVLLFAEIISFYKTEYSKFSSGILSKILAFVGLISITITGMLGGVIVYGLSADPFAGMVLKLLGISL